MHTEKDFGFCTLSLSLDWLHRGTEASMDWTRGMITLLDFFNVYVAARDCWIELDFPIKQRLRRALKDCDTEKKLQKHWKGISLNFFSCTPCLQTSIVVSK